MPESFTRDEPDEPDNSAETDVDGSQPETAHTEAADAPGPDDEVADAEVADDETADAADDDGDISSAEADNGVDHEADPGTEHGVDHGAEPVVEPSNDGPVTSTMWSARRMQWVGAALVAVLAFGITVQIDQDEQQDYTSLRGVELVELLKSVDAANERLDRQIQELTATRDELQSSSAQSDEARRQARRTADELAILAGQVGAEGPGVRLTIRDPDKVLGAGNLLDVIQAMRDARAEAISINGSVRVVAQTTFIDTADGIQAGPVLLEPPFIIEAIGAKSRLDQVINFRTGVLDKLQEAGAQGSVTQLDDLKISVLAEATSPQYAQPDN